MRRRDRERRRRAQGADAHDSRHSMSRRRPHAAAPVKPHLDHPMDHPARARNSSRCSQAASSIWPIRSTRISRRTGGGPTTILPFLLLGVALLIALGFEFVNGFHDTANAVATVIYTHALPAQVAVVWSGCWNLARRARFERRRRLRHRFAAAGRTHPPGRLERRLRDGVRAARSPRSSGTWARGGSAFPASSSHTLIGSIVGVGVANALMRGQDGTSGVDWDQVTQGRRGAAVLAARSASSSPRCCCSLMKVVVRAPELYKAPEGAATRRRSGSAACWFSPARWCRSSTARTTARRAWASSC